MPHVVLAAGIVVVVLIGLIGLIVVYKMATDRIDLTYVVSEIDGAASLSRFQFLIFTFVIAMCFMVLALDTGQFPQVDPTVLGLIGISSASYVVSKAIQSRLPTELNKETPPPPGKKPDPKDPRDKGDSGSADSNGG
jgi:hypothetical protein